MHKECGNCTHAALYSGGVYCMEFNEQILNEYVAEDCGAFDSDTPILALVPALCPEREGVYVGHIEIPFYGKEEKVRGDIHRRLSREVVLMFGATTTVKSIE